MRKLVTILALAISMPTMSASEEIGRYQAFSYVGQTWDGRGFAWVFDTQTAQLKLCVLSEDLFSTQELQMPDIKCGTWSKDDREANKEDKSR